MAFHQLIQRLILVGADLGAPVSVAAVAPPARLRPLIDALAGSLREFDARAVRNGHRYRSSFWAIYLLSAVAVLCAMLPLALGWDDRNSFLHPYAALWVFAEIAVIGSVGSLYWLGHRKDWQGQWLQTRTMAELITYLPLVAPLVDHTRPLDGASWYARALPGESSLTATPEIVALCAANAAQARTLLEGAHADPVFRRDYAAWAIGVLQGQLAYHARLARRSHCLRHRIHTITTALFAVTALAALAHLVLHSRWLSLMTTFFPALAAALHGALAQSEAYRLEAASQAVAHALQRNIDDLQRVLADAARAAPLEDIRAPIEGAITVILQEHQDWYMLVQPHVLPLA